MSTDTLPASLAAEALIALLPAELELIFIDSMVKEAAPVRCMGYVSPSFPGLAVMAFPRPVDGEWTVTHIGSGRRVDSQHARWCDLQFESCLAIASALGRLCDWQGVFYSDDGKTLHRDPAVDLDRVKHELRHGIIPALVSVLEPGMGGYFDEEGDLVRCLITEISEEASSGK